MSELAVEFDVHSTQVSAWRNELKERAPEIFGAPRDKVDLKEAQAPAVTI